MVYFRLIASHFFTLLTSHVFCYLIIQAQGNQLEKSQGIDMKLMKYSFVF